MINAQRRISTDAVRFAHGMLLWLFACTPALAYSSYGLGQIECQAYLDRRAEDQARGDATNTAYIHSYLAGYLTAGNTLRGIVHDDANDVAINLHAAVQWLDAWCLGHRSMQVAVALESFWIDAAHARTLIDGR